MIEKFLVEYIGENLFPMILVFMSTTLIIIIMKRTCRRT